MTIILFLVVLSVLVLVHELGHFVVAKLCGVKTEEFGLGFPPRVAGYVRADGSWKRVRHNDRATYKGTIWSLNWLPLGGFVRLKGEQDVKNLDQDSFASKPAWQRGAILLAGVTMNVLLAWFIFAGGLLVGVPMDLEGVPAKAQINNRQVRITFVAPQSGAANAGIQINDELVSIADQAVTSITQVRENLLHDVKAGQSIDVSVRRDGQVLNLIPVAQQIVSLGRVGLGIGMADVGTVRLPFLSAFYHGAFATGVYLKAIFIGFGNLITRLVTLQGADEVAGPVGIAVMTGRVAQSGTWALLQFMALLSLNLAVINVLPIPALDGGRLLFVFMQSLLRRGRVIVWEARVHQIGFAILLALIVLVTINDLRTYGGQIFSFDHPVQAP